jgi:DNA-3-methyladenine glycosylase I
MPQRCAWAESDPLLGLYHDEEWGRPERDSRALWEKLILDGFQAGLAWITILRKRDAFREAFEGFDPAVIARYGAPEVARLLDNPGIVRSRAKIEATIGNARAYLAMQAAGEDFSDFVWGMSGGEPILRQPLARACLDLLTLRRRDFPARAVEDLASSPYFASASPARVALWRRLHADLRDAVSSGAGRKPASSR